MVIVADLLSLALTSPNIVAKWCPSHCEVERARVHTRTHAHASAQWERGKISALIYSCPSGRFGFCWCLPSLSKCLQVSSITAQMQQVKSLEKHLLQQMKSGFVFYGNGGEELLLRKKKKEKKNKKRNVFKGFCYPFDVF